MPQDLPSEQSSPWRSSWRIPEHVTYLNHGSFGPSPVPVREAERAWTERLEDQPMDFLIRQLEPELARVRGVLGRFLGTSGENLVLVDNATYGMNVAAASTALEPGDEILLSDHEYGAVLRIWERRAKQAGAKIVVVPLAPPFVTPAEIVEPLMSAVTRRTRVLVVSHVTSPTAVIFPLAEICDRARARGLTVCVDGPHALAMVDVELDGLGCDYYTASCHKWLCAPFGAGLLYAHPRVQPTTVPVVTSWGRTPVGEAPSWRDEFQWAGTRNNAAGLSIPTAIEFLKGVGLDVFRQHGHGLAQYARERIEHLTGLRATVPDSPDWYGTMISLPLPAVDAPRLQNALWAEESIEVPIVDWQGRQFVRPSCHLYNSAADVDRLVAALAARLP